jgi:hypothetical protein
MRYVSTLPRFGGDYYYILCCATVNDGKLDQAPGYGHSLKPVFLVASFPCYDHMPSILEQFSVRTISLDVLRAISAPHN